MDPLSVMASVAGLLTAAHEVAKLLRPYVSASRETPSIAAQVRDEAESTRTVLVGLQTLVRELSGRYSQGGALIGVDQVVAILTSGVLLFAELEGAVKGLIAVSPLLLHEGEATERIVWGRSLTQYRLSLRARMQWARQEKSLKSLLAQLQGFKVSVTVVLAMLQCDSDRRAQQLQTELAANVGALLESNRELSRRMVHLENAFDMKTIRSKRSMVSIRSISAATEQLVSVAFASPSSAPSVFEFVNDLETSRVYRRARRDTMDFSFRSSVVRTHAWSSLSGYSLAEISVLSVIALPLDLEDIANRHHYIDYNSDLMVKEELSAPKSEPSLAEGSIFHDCLKIHSQLLQIPGFRELFNRQWKAQCEEKGVNMSVTVQGEVDRERVWSHLDVFRALKGIFREDIGYQLLTNELGRYLYKEAHQDSSHSASQKVTYLFKLLYIDLGFSPQELSRDNDTLLKANIYFLKTLASLSKDLESLIMAGAINHVGDDEIDVLVSSVRESNLFPDSAYKQALENFVVDQRLFVRDLLGLVSASEKMAPRPLEPFISTPFNITTLLSSYASSEIELLVTIERMLLTPPRRHLWVAAVRQWSVTAETHRALMIIEEQKARRVLHGTLSSSEPNSWAVQSDRMLVTSCLELLSKALQMFPLAAQFFQGLLDMLPRYFAETEVISSAQRDDFIESERLVQYTLKITRGEVKQSELSQALKDLVLRVEYWQIYRPSQFGELIRLDKLSVLIGGRSKPEEFYVCLFTNILLFLEERTMTAETGDVTRKPYKLLMSGWIYSRHIVDVRCYIRPGYYKAQIWWQADHRIVPASWFSFMNEWQMVEWCRSLMELIRSHPTAPNPLQAPLFVQARKSPYTNESDNSDQDHRDKAGVATDVRTIRSDRAVHLPIIPVSDRGQDSGSKPKQTTLSTRSQPPLPKGPSASAAGAPRA